MSKDRFKVEITDMETKEKTTYYTFSEHLYQEVYPVSVPNEHDTGLENVKLVLQFASKKKRNKKNGK